MAILDEADRCVEGFAGAIGQATNNAAEYNGLIEALRIATDRRADQVEIFSDSELIVRQVNGQYKVRNEGLVPLYRQVRKLLAGFSLFRLTHVRREKNREADRLVNMMLDQEDSRTIHEVYGEQADGLTD